MVNLRRIFKMLTTTPNSSDGLIIRAERLEEMATKTNDHELAESMESYAKVLRELAKKGWSGFENKKFIRENLRVDGK